MSISTCEPNWLEMLVDERFSYPFFLHCRLKQCQTVKAESGSSAQCSFLSLDYLRPALVIDVEQHLFQQPFYNKSNTILDLSRLFFLHFAVFLRVCLIFLVRNLVCW